EVGVDVLLEALLEVAAIGADLQRSALRQGHAGQRQRPDGECRGRDERASFHLLPPLVAVSPALQGCGAAREKCSFAPDSAPSPDGSQSGETSSGPPPIRFGPAQTRTMSSAVTPTARRSPACWRRARRPGQGWRRLVELSKHSGSGLARP